MVAASILGGRALMPVEATVGAWKVIVAVRLAWRRIDALLADAPLRVEGMKLPAPCGHIAVQNIGYLAGPARKPILANIAFELRAGESLGIIGPSASGKSTLLRLIAGAWPCSSGVVRLDGADIYAWPRHDLNAHIGYLPQDVELFSGTVRENIARLTEGDPDAIVNDPDVRRLYLGEEFRL
jgi:ABC-type protease/lipase transport system fused ATPase/permease subunit